MRLPQIRMESQFIQLGFQIKKPVQHIEQPKAIQNIKQPKAKMEIETTKSNLIIDQSQTRAEEGFKPISQVAKETADLGKQKALEGISRRTRQGDELMRIENGGNPIKIQAKENSEKPYLPLGIGWIPSYGSVKIQYEPAKVDIEITPQKPEIEVVQRKPIHDYTPGDVSFYIEQKNWLKIDFVNLYDIEV